MRVASPTTPSRGRGLLDAPGISIVDMARAVCDAVQPHALHDPTEGGLATALSELAVASDGGLRLNTPTSLPILPETQAFCTALGLDPFGLLASGALLAAVAPADVPAALAALERSGAPGHVIGHVTEASAGLVLVDPTGCLKTQGILLQGSERSP